MSKSNKRNLDLKAYKIFQYETRNAMCKTQKMLNIHQPIMSIKCLKPVVARENKKQLGKGNSKVSILVKPGVEYILA